MAIYSYGIYICTLCVSLLQLLVVDVERGLYHRTKPYITVHFILYNIELDKTQSLLCVIFCIIIILLTFSDVRNKIQT